jgi:glycosyltransferase involved in cell wall biosynthesis
MRILFLNNFNYLRGGSEKVMLEEMDLLSQTDHEVAVFARSHERNDPAEFSEFFPPAMDTEQLGVSLKTPGTVCQLIYSRSARLGLREVLYRFRPDVAHAHNIYGRLSLSVVDELEAQGIPVVMTLHDLKPLCPSYLMLNHGKICELCQGKHFYQAVLTRCHKNSLVGSTIYAVESYLNRIFGKYAKITRFIAPSSFLRDKFVQFGWPLEKLVYLPNFIEYFPDDTIQTARNYWLCFGRLSREKGVRTLLMAYSALSSPPPLVIAGDGPHRSELETLAQETRMPVSFTGHLNQADIQTTLRHAKVVIMPSECYENAPLSLLEAFAYGKPVVGSRIGGIPEMIEDGINGLLFEAGSIEDLRTKLKLITKLPDERLAAMGYAGKQMVTTHFSAPVHYKGLISIYEDVLTRPCTSPT